MMRAEEESVKENLLSLEADQDQVDPKDKI